MAKFIEEKEIINSHINSYIDRVTDFSKYLSGSPTFTTYYNKDMLASSADMGLRGVHEIVGTESPIRYNKINNFPIYNIAEIPIQIETDEDDGTNTDIEGEGIILPDSGIVPLIDDCFYISYDNRRLLFRIVDVQISSITDKVLYKITYTYTKWDLSILEQNQISKEYETRFDNIGNKNIDGKVVIEKSIDKKISELSAIKDTLRERYTMFFYNDKLNTFILKDGSHLIYDNLLMEFIRRNELFIKKKTFLKNVYVEPLLPMSADDIYEYENSIYNNIQLDEYRAWSDDKEYLDYTPIFSRFSIFDVYKQQYPMVYQIKHYHSLILENIFDFDNIVKRYLLLLKEFADDSIDQTKKDAELKDLVEDIKDYKLSIPNEKSYLNVPMIMVIIDNVIKKLEELN